jgi:hypothetical protein
MKRSMLGWAVVGIFPIVGHTEDSLLDTTLEDTQLYFTSPLRWDEEDWLYFGGALVAIGTAHSSRAPPPETSSHIKGDVKTELGIFEHCVEE